MTGVLDLLRLDIHVSGKAMSSRSVFLYPDRIGTAVGCTWYMPSAAATTRS